jgi:tRNA A-37 threonylcarbamoyl transferase component Bud32
MKTINDLLQADSGYSNVIIQKQLQSKKNTVAYVTIDNKPRVIKWFVPGLKQQMKTEVTILKKASANLHVPHLYKIDNQQNIIIMSYIMGENLCDVINQKMTTISEKQQIMVLLAQWFARFHIHFKTTEEFYIRGDPSLRNFILRDHIWGVDFEEARIGKPVEDIAGCCASLLTTDPMFTHEKFQLCTRFIKAYNEQGKWKLGNINDDIAYALLEKIQWRPDDEELLRKYAVQIRNHGLK